MLSAQGAPHSIPWPGGCLRAGQLIILSHIFSIYIYIYIYNIPHFDDALVVIELFKALIMDYTLI